MARGMGNIQTIGKMNGRITHGDVCINRRQRWDLIENAQTCDKVASSHALVTDFNPSSPSSTMGKSRTTGSSKKISSLSSKRNASGRLVSSSQLTRHQIHQRKITADVDLKMRLKGEFLSSSGLIVAQKYRKMNGRAFGSMRDGANTDLGEDMLADVLMGHIAAEISHAGGELSQSAEEDWVADKMYEGIQKDKGGRR